MTPRTKVEGLRADARDRGPDDEPNGTAGEAVTADDVTVEVDDAENRSLGSRASATSSRRISQIIAVCVSTSRVADTVSRPSPLSTVMNGAGGKGAYQNRIIGAGAGSSGGQSWVAGSLADALPLVESPWMRHRRQS